MGSGGLQLMTMSSAPRLSSCSSRSHRWLALQQQQQLTGEGEKATQASLVTDRGQRMHVR